MIKIKSSTSIKSVIFKRDEVESLLNGLKSQFRKPIKFQMVPQPYPLNPFGLDFCQINKKQYWVNSQKDHPHHITKACLYKPGEKIFVKETWGLDPNWKLKGHKKVLCKTDLIDCDYPVNWKSSVHMPFSVSRFILEVVDVRCQRLSDITEQDAKAEGMNSPCLLYDFSYKNSFRSFWESSYGEDSWRSNPYVWAVTFKKL